MALLLLLLALSLLPGAASLPLFDQDEAAYAGFARGMVESGSWVLHDYPWSEMHRKPPLALWLIAASFTVLGESWFSLRLPGALCLSLSVLWVAWRGAAHFGRERAALAALLLATSLVPLFGRVALVDPALLLGETIAFFGLLDVLKGRRSGALSVGLGLAIGLLAKGPAILVFLGVGLPALAILHPERRRLLSTWLALALLLGFLPLLAWGWRTWQEDGGATVRWMLDWYLLKRTSGAVLGQSGPPGTYLLLFLLFATPWTGLLLAGALQLVRRRDLASERALLAWLLGGWIVWELLSSKLPAYSLGAWPALALVAAQPLLDDEGPPRWSLWVSALVSVALGLGLIGVGLALEEDLVLPGLALCGAWLLLSGPTAMVLLARGRRALGLGVGAICAPALLALAFTVGLPELRPRLHITWSVAQTVEQLAPAGASVHLVDAWRLPSLIYYLEGQGREVEIVPREARPGDGVWILAELPQELDGKRWARVEGWVPDKGVPTSFYVVVTGP